MNKFEVLWTGGFPCLCCGEWKIYKNGELLDVEIPFGNNPANTYGEYEESFDYGLNWETYEDGLKMSEWIEEYKEWLKTLTDNPQEWENIYLGFQKNDWRNGVCGGCH